MRVISKFKDFYDCIQRQGQDQTCVWIRNMETEELEKGFPFPTYLGGYRRYSDVGVYVYVIGFCGKIYPVLKMFDWRPKYQSFDTSKDAICHNVDDVTKFIEATYDDKQIDVYHSKGKNLWRFGASRGMNVRKGSVAEFFGLCAERQDSYEKHFVENGTPVFVARYRSGYKEASTITYHGRNNESKPDDQVKYLGGPTLGDLEFYRVFDTFRAFQEIHMYLGGVLGVGNPPVPEVSNDDLIQAKGFNLKTSFRKEPSKKR